MIGSYRKTGPDFAYAKSDPVFSFIYCLPPTVENSVPAAGPTSAGGSEIFYWPLNWR